MDRIYGKKSVNAVNPLSYLQVQFGIIGCAEIRIEFLQLPVSMATGLLPFIGAYGPAAACTLFPQSLVCHSGGYPMTRVIFGIAKFTVIGPDQQSDGKTYGQILCYGNSGESLELHFLRPDTAYLNETDSANNVISNRYDPASKTGIAYYPASTFSWYQSLISSAIDGGLCADVDDTYPGGNRVFTLLPLTVGVFRFVPNVVTWLKGHPERLQCLAVDRYDHRAMAAVR